jgi:hypothetical protein
MFNESKATTLQLNTINTLKIPGTKGYENARAFISIRGKKVGFSGSKLS